MENDEFYGEENLETRDYLKRRVDEYCARYPQNARLITNDLIGINGEAESRTRQTVIAINTIAALEEESTRSVIDFLFYDKPHPDIIRERLNLAPDLSSFLGIDKKALREEAQRGYEVELKEWAKELEIERKLAMLKLK